jgi:hypothetical protein
MLIGKQAAAKQVVVTRSLDSENNHKDPLTFTALKIGTSCPFIQNFICKPIRALCPAVVWPLDLVLPSVFRVGLDVLLTYLLSNYDD